jgi:uncharacterized membrane protein YphA (DoxX/SURF4 family)
VNIVRDLIVVTVVLALFVLVAVLIAHHDWDIQAPPEPTTTTT